MIDIVQIRAGRSELLGRTTELANDFLDRVVDRPVAQPVEFEKLLREMRTAGLPLDGDDPKQVIEDLANLAGRAVVATAGPRYFGFVSGGTMANFTGLAAGRHALLAKLGWDVERQGLFGAPAMTVVTSDESHVSVFASLQMLGLGSERVVR